MPQISIKNQIKKLVELRKIDSQVYHFKKDLKEKPVVLEELKNQFEQKKAGLKALEEKLKQIVVERKTQEGELEAKEEEIGKANAQLSQLKTNKEYQAKITEIENIKADKSIIEEKILLSYDEVEKVNVEVEKEKGVLAEEEKKYLAQKAEIDNDIKTIEDQIKVLEGQRVQMTPEIDPESLAAYDRLVEKREGLAVVPVQSNACGGCFMSVTPQMINEIKMYEKLICCESCNRILYIEEDV